MKQTQDQGNLRLILLVLTYFFFSPTLKSQENPDSFLDQQQIQQILQEELAKHGIRGFGNIRLGEGARLVIRQGGQGDLQIIGQKDGIKIIDSSGERMLKAKTTTPLSSAIKQPQTNESDQEPCIQTRKTLIQELIRDIKAAIPPLALNPNIHVLLLRLDVVTLQLLKTCPVPKKIKCQLIENPLLTNEVVRQKIVDYMELEK